MVVQKLSEVGETVAPGSAGGANATDAILVLADFNTLEVEVDDSENGIARLSKGMPAAVRVAFRFIEQKLLSDMGCKVTFLGESYAAGTRVRVIPYLAWRVWSAVRQPVPLSNNLRGPWSRKLSTLSTAGAIAVVGAFEAGGSAFESERWANVDLFMQGYPTGTVNFQALSDVSFAFTITPGRMARGVAFSLVLGMVSGFPPAWRASHIPVTEAMKEG